MHEFCSLARASLHDLAALPENKGMNFYELSESGVLSCVGGGGQRHPCGRAAAYVPAGAQRIARAAGKRGGKRAVFPARGSGTDLRRKVLSALCHSDINYISNFINLFSRSFCIPY